MLLPSAQTPVSVASLYCVKYDPSDPLMQLYLQAATQFNADNDPSLAALILVSLMNRMTLYHKQSCTDCAEGASVGTNLSGAGSTYVDINEGLGAVNQGLGAAEQAATSALGAASSLATGLASAIPIAGAITSIVSDIVNVFGQAHAQAVAKEQAVNCAAAATFNKYIPQLDAAVASGQLDAQTGIQTAQQIIDTISQNLDSVVSAHNWGWGAQQVLQAQLWFRQQWYPTLENSGGFGGVGGIVTGSNGIVLLALLFGVVLLAGKRKSE